MLWMEIEIEILHVLYCWKELTEVLDSLIKGTLHL